MAGGKSRQSPGKKRKSGGKKSPKSSPAVVARKEKKQSKEQYEEPAHAIRVVKKHKSLKVSVHLHKIPPKHIVFEPTPTHLVVHTLGHNKKLYLNKKYPDGVTVHASEDSEAKLEYGILTAFLKIDEDPNGILDVIERSAGSKRKRSIEAEPSDHLVEATPKKKKRKVAPVPEPEPESESEQEEEEEESEDDGEDDFEYGADYAEDEEEEDGDIEMEEEEEEEPKPRKKKQFLTTAADQPQKSSALDLIEQVNQKEDATRSKKLSSEKAKRAAITQQETVKEQRQSEKAKKKEQEKKRVEEELKQQKALRKTEKKEQKKLAAAAKPAPLTPRREADGSSASPRGVLRTPQSPALDKSRRVSFSSKVCVQPIPIVRSSTPLPDPMMAALRVNIEEGIRKELGLGDEDDVPDELVKEYMRVILSQQKLKLKKRKGKKGNKGKRR